VGGEGDMDKAKGEICGTRHHLQEANKQRQVPGTYLGREQLNRRAHEKWQRVWQEGRRLAKRGRGGGEEREGGGGRREGRKEGGGGGGGRK
jgi:hypothetical protein